MKVQNYHDVVAQLLPHLADYLEEHGYNTEKNFSCFVHEDNNPSCSINGGNNRETYHCFGCGAASNIFGAAHHIEGKPIVGNEFIIDNLVYLANKYGVEVDMAELTEEEVYELDTYRAYRAAAQLITFTGRAATYATDRGLSEETCKTYGVGSIQGFSHFRARLKSAGFPAKFLDDIDLGRKDIFNEGNLVFTIHDEKGRPVGFAARNLDFGDEGNSRAKYVNQKTTGLKCNIYQKGKRLYGLFNTVATQPLYIFEGYTDVLMAHQHGIQNCVAIGGTAFTQEHVLTLKENGFYDIILCLDGDEPGQQKTEELLDGRLSGQKDLDIKILTLPIDVDPDEYICKYGADEFNELARWTAFEWRLNRYPENADPQEVCDKMIGLIVNESNYIRQENMCRSLTQATGFDLRNIQAELRRRLDEKDLSRQKDRDLILQRLQMDISKNPDDAEMLMTGAIDGVRSLNCTYNQSAYSSESFVEFLQDCKTIQEERTSDFAGYRLGSDLQGIEQALCGEWKKDVVLFFGGRANAGKSSFLVKMGWEIASHLENDATVIYHTTDDSKEQLLPKLICVAEGSRDLHINHVLYPAFYETQGVEDVQLRRQAGYNAISALAREGRYIMKDGNDGSTLGYAESLLANFRHQYPDRNLVYVCDNFHVLKDFKGMDPRIRFVTLSQTLKSLAVKYHATILATVEYRKIKTGLKPGNDDISETVQLSYDGSFIGHLFNELHEFGPQKAQAYHMNNGQRSPRVELIFGKNKISGFKGSKWLDFYPESSDFVEVPEDVLIRQVEEAQEQRNAVVNASDLM